MDPSRAKEQVTGVPAWLRPAAMGCAAITFVLLAVLVGTLMSPTKLLVGGVAALGKRVEKALPPSTSEQSRERLSSMFRCLRAAVAERRLDREGVAPVGAVCRKALEDGSVTEAELNAILEAAEAACVRCRDGRAE
ncbi:MAG: hypothetical protein ACOY3Y_14525 [Acidobacteriota bacterium]